MFRTVLDTNTVISGILRPGPQSPHRALLRLGLVGCFQWLISDDILLEYIEKLIALGVPENKVQQFTEQLLRLAEPVAIRSFHFRHYPVDPDDVAFLLAAVNGLATHLITRDRHLRDIAHFYQEFTTCTALEFLHELQGQGFDPEDRSV
jgi:uncharacterized protein